MTFMPNWAIRTEKIMSAMSRIERLLLMERRQMKLIIPEKICQFLASTLTSTFWQMSSQLAVTCWMLAVIFGWYTCTIHANTGGGSRLH